MKRQTIIILLAVLLLLVGVLVYQLWRLTFPEKVVIRLIGEAVSTVDAIDKIKDDFTKETGIHVEVEKYEFETALQKATLDLTSRTGRYDIILQYGVALGKFAEQGHLYEMKDLLPRVPPRLLEGFKPESDLFQPVWSELSWYKGKLYGYPFAANTMFVWYRKDLISDPAEIQAFRKKYGYDLRPPTYWKEYRDIAEFFTRHDQNFYGVVLQGKRHPAVWYEWLNFAFSFGGGVMEKEHGWEYGPLIVNSPETLAATEFYLSLKRFSPPGTTNYTWDDALTAMQQGRIFMCIMWSDAVFGVEDPSASKVVGSVGYAPPPAGPNGSMAQIAGGSYFISKYSKNPAAALQFILWSLQKEKQVKQQLLGGASAVKNVYSDPRVMKLPYTKAYVASMEHARYMTDTVAETTQISDILQIALSEALIGKKTAKAVLDWAAVEINKLSPVKFPMKYPVK